MPCDWPVFVARMVVAHRLGETPRLFEIVVRPAFELTQRVLGKEMRPAPGRGDFPCGSLRAILAEFERMRIAGLRVRAADTLIARWLVLMHQRQWALNWPALPQKDLTHGTRGAPASHRPPIRLDGDAPCHSIFA